MKKHQKRGEPIGLLDVDPSHRMGGNLAHSNAIMHEPLVAALPRHHPSAGVPAVAQPLAALCRMLRWAAAILLDEAIDVRDERLEGRPLTAFVEP